MPLLQPGQIIRDTYEVERLLGEGAFAEVYRVKHRFMGRQAMKVFKTSDTTLEELNLRLEEARTLSTLGHHNIVGVYDANVIHTADGYLGFFTMTYAAGGTLDTYWRSFGANLMPITQAVEIVTQACRGLAVAHSFKPPIVHRDIKPQNILMGYDANGLHVRLSDFGLAKRVNPLTLLVTAMGTPGFKPPESMRENLDSLSADIWALGTTLYLLLTDQMPFPGLDEVDVVNGGNFDRPLRPPSIYNRQVDPALESIVYRMLAIAPEDRYRNAQQLLKDLERWKPGQSARIEMVSQSQGSTKQALGPRCTPIDMRDEARRALDEAKKLAQDPAKLMSAADLLEEAITKDPALRDSYESQLQLWRRGIVY